MDYKYSVCFYNIPFQLESPNANTQIQMQIHKYKCKYTNTNANTQIQMQIHRYKCKYTDTNLSQDFQFHRGGMPGLASVTDACVVGLPSRLPSHFQAFTSPLPVRACVHAALTVHTHFHVFLGICGHKTCATSTHTHNAHLQGMCIHIHFKLIICTHSTISTI